MKRQTILLAVLVLAIVTAVVLIVSKQSNVSNKISVQAPDESNVLLESNNLAVNGASAKTNASVPAISEADQLLFGDKLAILKMVVYEDLTNPFSLSYDASLKQAEKDFAGKLAVYVRPYFESDNALALSYQTAVVCAGEEGKYKELRSFIFEKKPLTTEALIDGAKELGLNGTKFAACLNNSDNQAKIAQSVQAIRMIAVYGAPTSILDGEIITGARALTETKNGEGEAIEGLKSVISRHLIGK